MGNLSPFSEGYKAAIEGKPPSVNPYPLHSNKWVRWNSGYTAGERDRKAALEVEEIVMANIRRIA